MEGEKVECKCGSVVLRKNLAAHNKTQKHLKGIGLLPTVSPATSAANNSDIQQVGSSVPIQAPKKSSKIKQPEPEDLEEEGDDIEDLSDNEVDNEFFAEMDELQGRFDELEDKIDEIKSILIKYLKIELPKPPGKPATFRVNESKPTTVTFSDSTVAGNPVKLIHMVDETQTVPNL